MIKQWVFYGAFYVIVEIREKGESKMSLDHQVRDISISGSGVINGGEYDRVKISGSGKIQGNVEANSIKISGSGLIDGDVRTAELNVSGSTNIRGSVKSEVVINNGSLVIEDDVQTLQLTNNGSIRFHESVTAKMITTRGSFSADEDVDAEQFDSKGSIKIKESLTAKKIIIEINGKCYAEKVQGEEIIVKLSPFSIFTAIIQFIVQLFAGKSGLNRMRTESIQGTRIQVEHVDVKTIRGDDVVIGPDSEVELVEYTNSIYIHSRAKVKQQIKV